MDRIGRNKPPGDIPQPLGQRHIHRIRRIRKHQRDQQRQRDRTFDFDKLKDRFDDTRSPDHNSRNTGEEQRDAPVGFSDAEVAFPTHTQPRDCAATLEPLIHSTAEQIAIAHQHIQNNHLIELEEFAVDSKKNSLAKRTASYAHLLSGASNDTIGRYAKKLSATLTPSPAGKVRQPTIVFTHLKNELKNQL